MGPWGGHDLFWIEAFHPGLRSPKHRRRRPVGSLQGDPSETGIPCLSSRVIAVSQRLD